MCEFYEKICAGARVFEHSENMPARAPAISDLGKPAARALARKALLTHGDTHPRPRAGQPRSYQVTPLDNTGPLGTPGDNAGHPGKLGDSGGHWGTILKKKLLNNSF